jgi:hypothetical protein
MEAKAHRKKEKMRYAGPIDVICPRCKADTGNPCKDSHTFHQERVEAAKYAFERLSRNEGADKSTASE